MLDELYADDVISIDVMSDPAAEPQRWQGLPAVREKHECWANAATVHNIDVEGPFAGNGDDHFVVRFAMDVSMEGRRNQMIEGGLSTVGWRQNRPGSLLGTCAPFSGMTLERSVRRI